MPLQDSNQLSWVYDLLQLGRHLVLDQDPAKVRQQILRHIVDTAEASSGSLSLVDADTGVLSIVAGIDLPEEAIGKAIAKGEGILGWVRERREALILAGDVSSDPQLRGREKKARSRGPASAICWPLANIEGQFIGIVSANRGADAPPFTQADLEHGKALVNLVTLIIENQWLHERQRRRIEALSRMNQEIRDMNKRLEEAHYQLLQAEKMASMGRLAAGVAHEINNPLGYVYSNLGTLETYLRELFSQPPDQAGNARRGFLRQQTEALLSESIAGIERVSRIVRDLKDFSRLGDAEWKWIDLHESMDSVLNIVANEIKYKARLVKEYGDVPKVRCLPSRLHQVFLNILMNAAQAIEKEGTITLRTAASDGEVRVSISDTGKGIAAEHLSRIFEPFFTTKPPGQGTGLGLSLSYSIVRRHQGRIEVDSAPGRGTTFTVHLPVCPAEDVAAEK